MKCIKCDREFNGNFCPNCGTAKGTVCNACGAKIVGNDNDFCEYCGEKLPKKSKLLGFRSRKVWKMIVSSVYLFFVAMMLIPSVFMFDIEDPEFSMTSIFVMLYMVSPYIFLSNFSYRKHLPLFKKHRIGSSIAGMVCVFLIITILFSLVFSFMPQNCVHKWVKTTEGIEATCVQKGQDIWRCTICNGTKAEISDKKEHLFAVYTTPEGEITVKCSSCGKVVNAEITDHSETTDESKPFESDSAVG